MDEILFESGHEEIIVSNNFNTIIPKVHKQIKNINQNILNHNIVGGGKVHDVYNISSELRQSLELDSMH